MAAPAVPPINPRPDTVTIKKYDPKAAAALKKRVDDDQFLISPITGEKVPAAQAAEHMKVGLLDPRWVEERDKATNKKATEEVVYAPGQSIESNLKRLAERRTDIFGVGDEAAQETSIGSKMGEEEPAAKPGKNSWDGHSGTAEAAARAARQNVSVDDQIAQIHKAKGLVPERTPEPERRPAPAPLLPPQMPPRPAPMPVPTPVLVPVQPLRPVMMAPTPVFAPMAMPRPAPMPPMVPMGHAGPSMTPAYIPPGMQVPPISPPSGIPIPPSSIHLPHVNPPQPRAPPLELSEPPNKRQKTEESLIPEDMFLARHRGNVTFNVMVPVVEDKQEWKLNGQMLSVTLALTDTVAVLKNKVGSAEKKTNPFDKPLQIQVTEELGMPQGKQKLQHENIFYKDANSLAYYNVTEGMILQLHLKERGGRKK